MLRRLKESLKSAVLAALYHSGLLKILLDRRLRGGAVILMYHRVLPEATRSRSFSAGGIVVSPETFRMQMQLIKRMLTPLTPEQFAGALTSPAGMPRGACLVTFDDGWWDNAEHAAPILEACAVPAVLFVATDYIGTDRCFWQERLSRMLYLAYRQGERAAACLRTLDCERILRLPEPEARLAIREVVAAQKTRPQPDIDALIDRMTGQLRELGVATVDNDEDRFLSWPEARKLAASQFVRIGSHCCSHTPLTKLSADAVCEELRRSRNVIRAELGIDTLDLAYPNGDHDAHIADLARSCGYRMAFTTERGHHHLGDDPLRIRRLNIHEQSTDTAAAFMARIAGLI